MDFLYKDVEYLKKTVGEITNSHKNVNVSSHILFEDNFETLNNWTVLSGSPVVTDGICSLPNPTSTMCAIKIALSGDLDPWVDRKYVIEAIFSAPTTQKIVVRLESGATLLAYNIQNASGDTNNWSMMGELSGITAVMFSNCKTTDRHKVLLLIDPVSGSVGFYCYYKDSVNGKEMVEQIGNNVTYSPGKFIDSFKLQTGTPSGGTITMESFKIYVPWAVCIGDSVSSGFPQHSPVPSIVVDDDPKSCCAYWVEKGMGNSRIILQQGQSGNSSTVLLERYEKAILAFCPEVVIINIGTNDANMGIPIATTKSNLITIVDGVISTGAKVYLNDIAPQTQFDVTKNTWKAEWNTWLPEFAASRPNLTIVNVHDLLESPFISGALHPKYDADTVHWTTLGQKVAAEAMWDAIMA